MLAVSDSFFSFSSYKNERNSSTKYRSFFGRTKRETRVFFFVFLFLVLRIHLQQVVYLYYVYTLPTRTYLYVTVCIYTRYVYSIYTVLNTHFDAFTNGWS